MISRLLSRAGRYRTLAVLAIVVLTLATVADVSACPTCKEGLDQADPHGQSIAAGYYYSILFMMSMPFIILTTFGSFAYRSVKKAQREADAKRTGDQPERG